NAAEAEYGRENRDHEKEQSQPEHLGSPLLRCRCGSCNVVGARSFCPSLVVDLTGRSLQSAGGDRRGAYGALVAGGFRRDRALFAARLPGAAGAALDGDVASAPSSSAINSRARCQNSTSWPWGFPAASQRW